MRRFLFHTTAVFLLGVCAYGQDRLPAVAGSFYAGDKSGLEIQLEQLFSKVEDRSIEKDVAAVIVPHAGYVFSGQVAAAGFAKVDPERVFKRVFVVGTSHHMMLRGASIFSKGDYITPLGTVRVDTELASELIQKHKLISFVPEAHSREHSLEVQLPFLQYYLKKPFKIVPIVIGTQSAATCEKLAEILRPYFSPENLFVISSDFSHYPSYEDASATDMRTAEAVLCNSPARFMEARAANEQKDIPGLATSCCGWSSVLTLLEITSKENILVQHVKYLNSGDSPYGDHDRVVGYHAFVFSRRKTAVTIGLPTAVEARHEANQEQMKEAFTLTKEDKLILLDLARQAIEARLENRDMPEVDENKLSGNLKTHCGAFVTLNLNDRLRGCIGRFMPEEPLYKVVQEMAVSAAFRDHRFYPVKKNELKDIHIEISVLTPLRRIHSKDEFILGEQGIYMIKGQHSGTFLPQVAGSTGWSKEEFLGHCARDKAGIGWEGWKDAELYTYEALVFEEHRN